MMMMMMMRVPRVGVSIGSCRLGSRIDERRNRRKVTWMRTCLKIEYWFMLEWCARVRKRGRVSLKTGNKEVKELKNHEIYIKRKLTQAQS